MNRIFALAVKDLRLLLRDKPGFFFVFFFPLIYAVFFGMIFSSEGGGGMSSMKIAVVDEDESDTSRKFMKKLRDSEEMEVELTSRRDAEDLVRRGEKLAYVLIPSGFEESRDQIFQGEPIAFEVGLDPGRQAESGIIQGLLTQHAYSMLQDLFLDRQAMRKQIRSVMTGIDEDEEIAPVTRGVLKTFMGALDAFLVNLPEQEGKEGAAGPMSQQWRPIKIDFHGIQRKQEGPKSSFDITMPQSFVWVFLGCAAAFGISLVTERTRGTLLRLRSAPISLGHILAGKALACFITSIGDLILLFAFFYIVFNVRPGSYPMLAFAMFCSAIAFVGIMMLISVSGKTEASAGGLGWAFLLIMAMLGGGMVPYFFMPAIMKTVSHVSFVKWSILALEGAVWRDFSFQEMLLPCGILLAIGVGAFSAGVLIFKKTAE